MRNRTGVLCTIDIHRDRISTVVDEDYIMPVPVVDGNRSREIVGIEPHRYVVIRIDPDVGSLIGGGSSELEYDGCETGRAGRHCLDPY